MVAVGDFGIAEREKIVMLALSRGWIQGAEQKARANGCPDPVVVLLATDALELLPFRFNVNPRHKVMERIQRSAGCKRFTVGVVRYASLLKGNAAENWEADMEEMRQKGGISVVCINRSGQFLAAVCRES